MTKQETLPKGVRVALPSVSNGLDPDQAQHFLGPDMGLNCVER